MRDTFDMGRLVRPVRSIAAVILLAGAFAVTGTSAAFAALSTTVTYGAAGGTQINGSWTFLSGPGTITLSGATASSTVTYKYGIAAIPQEGPGWPEIPTPVVISTYTGVVSYSTPGSWQLVYYSTDASGNVETAKTSLFILRSPAPDTISDVQKTYIDSATITLVAAAMPGGASVLAGMTFYKLDGGAATSGTSITTGLGAHTLEFWSIDAAGNAEAHNYAEFDVIHATAPVTSDNAVSDYVNSAQINLTVAAVPAGVVATTYRSLDGGDFVTGLTVNVSADGPHSLKYYSEDNYGNVEAVHTVSFVVHTDNTAPVTTGDVQPTYASSPAVIHLSGEDEPGGSEVASLHYIVDGGSEVVLTESATPVATTGDHAGPPIPVTATDADIFVGAGYTHTGGPAPLAASMCSLCHLKASSPSITTTQRDAGPFADLGTWQSIGGLASDFPHAAKWPCAHCHLDIVTPPPTVAITAEVHVSGAGSHTIQYWSVDTNGNTEDRNVATFTIQGTAVTQNYPSSPWARVGQTVTLSGTCPGGTLGAVMRVNVKKPGKSYWSYSSARVIYAGPGGVPLWQYKYTFRPGMTLGTYYFQALYGTSHSLIRNVILK